MFKGTTILFVKKDGKSVIIGDGQVTLGNTVLKHKAKKVRKIYKDKIVVGFAGSTADAFTLFSRLESKLEQFSGNLERAVIELAKDWRTDKYLRRLEAMMIVTNGEKVYLLSGVGDVVEPDIPVVAIGSGGPYAYAAAKALYENTSLSAKEIAEKAMEIAGDICIYTNKNFTIETI
ncbi:ATP-dependent HslUV protease, peptidase subunit HslV [Thermotomaculum hydrothermale]|uniref:ATP-dependent protease subunit HslV n=1 Tax=Thermotomaculum hydrothermale TaxID=981385 RepID=A0A7R6PEL6_9BACT|nr:ATP-dependent protease subunit HslV [Thermotomaculum hydrothermale]BBB32299.1 ATP-dependent HslUV protease, peptidase subunit HslV [Thermotomaculum hydrothermale]